MVEVTSEVSSVTDDQDLDNSERQKKFWSLLIRKDQIQDCTEESYLQD